MPSFKDRFSGSQVIDAGGQPLMVYHGTGASYDEFSLERLGAHTAGKSAILGGFFSNSPVVAGTFAYDAGGSPQIRPSYLVIRKPWTIKAREFYNLFERTWHDPDLAREKIKKLKATMMQKGFDGIRILADPKEPNPKSEFSADQWIVFSADQVISRFEPGAPGIDLEAIPAPSFEDYFGSSKVVDEAGRPKVLYHGTGKSFSRFKGISWASEGLELPYDYAMMRDYCEGGEAQIMPLYMRIERPFNADYGLSKTVTIGDMVTTMMEQSEAHGIILSEEQKDRLSDLIGLLRECRIREESGPNYERHNFWCESHMLFGKEGEAAIMEIFQILGFDGITMMEGGERTWGALSPDQVMSRFDERALPLQLAKAATDQPQPASVPSTDPEEALIPSM